MLVKEYRILLPLTVDEYRIAQLFMIQKKTRQESSGHDAGVEILVNQPYENGPGGSGQYTFKNYHVGSKIPAWIRSVIPGTLVAHEESWNAYPETKTRYSTPVMERVSIEVNTIYCNDAGTQENIFNLQGEELKNRIIDVMDFVADPISSGDYEESEDPKLFKSIKTGRGPLKDDWVQDAVKHGKPIMCAYKMCKVEFRYWGLQTRAERWIHDLALRKTMLRAHRQAWAWQDEWFGLTIEDIRRLEHDLALHLSTVMNKPDDEGTEEEEEQSDASSDVYYDCAEGPVLEKPSIIRWSSELELECCDENSAPPTPNCTADAALLVMVFHGDFSPDHPADSKTTDSKTFKSTIDSLITRHYPQLRERVHVVLVSCGSELSGTVARLSSISPNFGLLHPSLALFLSADPHHFNEAVEGTIRRANETFAEFVNSQPNFNGEVFVVGDAIGGLLLYEAMVRRDMNGFAHKPAVTVIPEDKEDGTLSCHDLHIDLEVNGSTPRMPPRSPRQHSAPPSAGHLRKKISFGAMSVDSIMVSSLRLVFQPSTAFLLGCPLGLVLAQRKLAGQEVDHLECQLFNLYYPLDPCGCRVEPVLMASLAMAPAVDIPKYQRFPLGDGKPFRFDVSLDRSALWGDRRIDQLLYCPNGMVNVPSTALPHILHASYWESQDVAAFVLRQFVRGEEAATQNCLLTSTIPLTLALPPIKWQRRRSRFKIGNLSPNHRANDLLVVSGSGMPFISAKFFYGPMDLVALSRELVTVFVCPQQGDWYQLGTFETDSHGRLAVHIKKELPCGLHSVKMVVNGDRSYLDAFVAVVLKDTRCVVFSVDGSLTGSISVTGKDPRVRPGAVDVVRHWHDQGFVIVYLTARPDMQQRTLSAWLAQHNFPHGLLFFNPSFSTEPLKQKSLVLKHIIDMGVRVHAAYGSGKDVNTVYCSAGVDPERIYSVSGSKRRSCNHIESYSQHLAELNGDSVWLEKENDQNTLSADCHRPSRNVQRTASFTPRGGKFENDRR